MKLVGRIGLLSNQVQQGSIINLCPPNLLSKSPISALDNKPRRGCTTPSSIAQTFTYFQENSNSDRNSRSKQPAHHLLALTTAPTVLPLFSNHWSSCRRSTDGIHSRLSTYPSFLGLMPDVSCRSSDPWDMAQWWSALDDLWAIRGSTPFFWQTLGTRQLLALTENLIDIVYCKGRVLSHSYLAMSDGSARCFDTPLTDKLQVTNDKPLSYIIMPSPLLALARKLLDYWLER